MSTPSQISKIDAMVTVLWLIKRVDFFDSPGISLFFKRRHLIISSLPNYKIEDKGGGG